MAPVCSWLVNKIKILAAEMLKYERYWVEEYALLHETRGTTIGLSAAILVAFLHRQHEHQPVLTVNA